MHGAYIAVSKGGRFGGDNEGVGRTKASLSMDLTSGVFIVRRTWSIVLALLFDIGIVKAKEFLGRLCADRGNPFIPLTLGNIAIVLWYKELLGPLFCRPEHPSSFGIGLGAIMNSTVGDFDSVPAFGRQRCKSVFLPAGTRKDKEKREAEVSRALDFSLHHNIVFSLSFA